MGDASIEGSSNNGALGLHRMAVAEVLPHTQRQHRELQSGLATESILHATVVAIRIRNICGVHAPIMRYKGCVCDQCGKNKLMAPDLKNSRTLRLVWPQWQGATRDNVEMLLPEVPIAQAQRGYAIGAKVLDAILPKHAGPTEVVPVEMSDFNEGSTNGIESRTAILNSLDAALEVLYDRILTLGGECSVSVAPFAALSQKYGEDLALIWVDSHPDVGTPSSDYDGYHAMAVSVLLGHGDEEIVRRLTAIVPAERVALAGLHDWTEDDYPNIAAWGLTFFSPDDLRDTSEPLLQWLASTGATKVAIHFDVDTVDSNEMVLGLGKVSGGLSGKQVRRLIKDISTASEVVGFTVAEFIPRDVLAVRGLLDGLPLIPK